MNLITGAPRGTKDILPAEASKWRFIEKTIVSLMPLYGFGEIRTPTFEHTELFERGVGGTTDVVQKEMYTFADKGGRSITLKPEGTAPVVRSLLESGLYAEAMPQKLYYFTNCFRYEKPQAGRWREFTQFGAEVFGASLPEADAEIIEIPYRLFEKLGLTENISLQINSIGCPECRPSYHRELREYFKKSADKLCPTCLERLEKNPMRILDCKSPVCSAIAAGAPKTADFLCGGCEGHFEELKRLLSSMGIKYEVNPSIVRGLDYYTKTVFEFVTDLIGAQGTVCGGGRYDRLCEELGGPPIAGLGFGMGLGRLLLCLEAAGFEFPPEPPVTLYIASIGENARILSCAVASRLRAAGIAALSDTVGRSVKAQMKYADKNGALYTLVMGDDECASGIGTLRRMADGQTKAVQLSQLESEL